MSQPATDAPELAPAALASWLAEGRSFTLLDVRNRDEFESWHVSGPHIEAVQVPHQQFIAARVQGTTAELVPDGPEPVLVVCGVGEASAEVAAQLQEAGVDAHNLAGGMDAWARYYEAVELPCSTATVLQYHRPSSGCLAYLVVGGDEGDAERPAAVIDPLGAFADRYAADSAERGATIAYAVDTHVHADHVSGVREVAAAAETAAVFPESFTAHDPTFDDEPRLLADGDALDLGDVTLEALALPGHTPEMMGLRLADPEHGDLLFGGDTLFLSSVARPDLAVEASAVSEMARTLHATLADLNSLPGDTRLLPGHVAEAAQPDESGGHVATLGDLRETIDLLGLEESAFVQRVTDSPPERPANDERIRRINLGREEVDGETAFDLELGPNNCAVE
jgi:glyoxylase-like metal-dependent hydrolase (beta-lactamase superfamily II)